MSIPSFSTLMVLQKSAQDFPRSKRLNRQEDQENIVLMNQTGMKESFGHND